MNDEEKKVIVEVLTSQALADHLGDVRDAEMNLWELLGIDHNDYPDDYDSAWQVTKYRLIKHGLYVPDDGDEEDYEEA